MSSIIRLQQQGNRDAKPQPVAFNLDDVRQRGEQYLDQVRAQAGQLIETAKQQAGELYEQSRKEGANLGARQQEAIIREEVRKHIATILPELRQRFDEIAQLRDAWMKEWENNVIQLAICIAERVIGHERTSSGMPSDELIREALGLVSSNASAKVHLNPEDFELLKPRENELLRSIRQVADAELVSDTSLDRGDCRVFTGKGEIDQRLSTRLARIEEELIGPRAEASESEAPDESSHSGN